MIRLTVPEIVVQGFAAVVVVLVVAGVLAVLRLGARARPRRSGERQPAVRAPVGTSSDPLRVDPTHRNGTSRELLRR